MCITFLISVSVQCYVAEVSFKCVRFRFTLRFYLGQKCALIPFLYVLYVEGLNK